MIRVAAIQMNSGADVRVNLDAAGRLLADAASAGCTLAVLPENFALMPARGRDKAAHAEKTGEGPIQDFLSAAAAEHGLWIVAGSMPMVAPEPERVYGACPVFDAQGALQAVYRKIHLFDVDIHGGQESYRESRSMYPGDEVVHVEAPFGSIGLTICYDLRFPELYRRLADAGVGLFTVPAAFTVPTGRAHWHTLLCARAIENLAYVIAAGQCGQHPDGRATYGHSLIVDPWGKVLAECEDGPGLITAEIDKQAQSALRSEFPALLNRKL